MDRNQYLQIRKESDFSQKKWALLTHYLKESLFIAAIVCLAIQGSLLKLLAIPVLACLIFRNFSLMHDAVHKAVSKNSMLNESLGLLAGAICLLPFEQWRRSHLDHHTWSGNLDKDPVTAFITIFPKLSPKVQSTLNLFWKSWFPLLAVVQYTVFWALAAKITMTQRRTLKLALSSLSPLLFWGLIGYLSSANFMITIVAPAIILYMVAVEVVNFPHHLQLPQYRGNTRLPFWEQYKVSRSCDYPKWFANWVVLNFNYHTEHHLFPEVPWYHLPDIQPKLKSILGEAYNTDPHFTWILENKPKDLSAVIHYSSIADKNAHRRAS